MTPLAVPYFEEVVSGLSIRVAGTTICRLWERYEPTGPEGHTHRGYMTEWELVEGLVNGRITPVNLPRPDRTTAAELGHIALRHEHGQSTTVRKRMRTVVDNLLVAAWTVPAMRERVPVAFLYDCTRAMLDLVDYHVTTLNGSALPSLSR